MLPLAVLVGAARRWAPVRVRATRNACWTRAVSLTSVAR